MPQTEQFHSWSELGGVGQVADGGGGTMCTYLCAHMFLIMYSGYMCSHVHSIVFLFYKPSSHDHQQRTHKLLHSCTVEYCVSEDELHYQYDWASHTEF